MADASIKKFFRSFLEVVPKEFADKVVDPIVQSTETIPLTSSSGDPRATAEERLDFQIDFFQAYGSQSEIHDRIDQFLTNNTFSITLSKPDDLTPIDVNGHRFYAIKLSSYQTHLLQHVKRLVILIRLRDYDSFDTYRRGASIGFAIAEAVANRPGGPFDSIMVHFHFERRRRVSWVMRTFEMQNIVLGMEFGGGRPDCAEQLRFALTDGVSHPDFDPGLVHDSDEEPSMLEWEAGKAAGLAKAIVDKLFERARGKPLQLTWR